MARNRIVLGIVLAFLLGFFINITPSFAWLNTSFPYCNDLTINNTANSNNISVVFFFINNTGNFSGFIYGNFSDLVFFNDTINGGNNSIQLNYSVLNFTNATNVFGYVKLDRIAGNSYRNISYCYGNASIKGTNNGKLVYPLYDAAFTSLNTSIWSNTSIYTIANGSIYITGNGASWTEVQSVSTFSVDYCMITNASFNTMTQQNQILGWHNALGGGSGGWGINSIQIHYPVSSQANYRNYITGDNSAGSGYTGITYTFYEICRNSSTPNISYRINNIYNGAWTNFSGTQILTNSRPIRVSTLYTASTIGVGTWLVRPYSYPEARFFIGARQTYSPPVLPYSTPIIDNTTICFTIVNACMVLGNRNLYFNNTRVII